MHKTKESLTIEEKFNKRRKTFIIKENDEEL